MSKRSFQQGIEHLLCVMNFLPLTRDTEDNRFGTLNTNEKS